MTKERNNKKGGGDKEGGMTKEWNGKNDVFLFFGVGLFSSLAYFEREIGRRLIFPENNSY